MANPNIVALGKMTITAAGTTVKLSVNCGAQAGAVGGTNLNPPTAGKPFRQFTIMADAGNTKNVYLLPAGKTLSANPGLVIAAIPPGGIVPIPNGISLSSGYLPENFCLDTDTSNNIAYGFGILG